MTNYARIAALLLCTGQVTARAAVFQYAAEVHLEKAPARALLWIPSEAPVIRGLVVAGQTLMEAHFVCDPTIRSACADSGLAILHFSCGLSQPDLPVVLDDLAVRSGYAELRRAPLLFVGHSAGGPQAQDRTVKHADRTFALIQYRGGMPSRESPIAPGIPSVALMAQYDEFWGTMRTAEGVESWERAREYIAGFRAANPTNLGSFVVEPGAGHFPWSERNAAYLALFIRKAAARLPAPDPAADTPPVLPPLDPDSGWLTSLDLKATPIPCSAAADYSGDKAATSWHFDREMAEATLAYHRGLTGRKDQFLRWNDPFWVDAGTRFFFTQIKWTGDGSEFEVHPVYADTYPAQHNGQGPRWPQAGEACGNSGAPIHVRPVGGPLEVAGDLRLRLAYSAIFPVGNDVRATFLAFSPGNDEYRHTELVGMLPRGFKGLTAGKPQVIEFPELPDVTRDSGPVPLAAACDSGRTVQYYVAVGPAVVENGTLRLAEVPRRATLPITVEVVAYQPGSGIDPKFQAAPPVRRSFRIIP